MKSETKRREIIICWCWVFLDDIELLLKDVFAFQLIFLFLRSNADQNDDMERLTKIFLLGRRRLSALIKSCPVFNEQLVDSKCIRQMVLVCFRKFKLQYLGNQTYWKNFLFYQGPRDNELVDSRLTSQGCQCVLENRNYSKTSIFTVNSCSGYQFGEFFGNLKL